MFTKKDNKNKQIKEDELVFYYRNKGEQVSLEEYRNAHVVHKQDTFVSKAARKYWLTRKYIPILIIYNMVCFSISILFLSYSAVYFYQKETPLFLFDKPDGEISCANVFGIEDNHAVSILGSSEEKLNLCKELGSFDGK